MMLVHDSVFRRSVLLAIWYWLVYDLLRHRYLCGPKWAYSRDVASRESCISSQAMLFLKIVNYPLSF
jgi:hypothetical protein